MSKTNIIHQLRLAGFKVRVTCYRYVVSSEAHGNIVKPSSFSEYENPHFIIFPKLTKYNKETDVFMLSPWGGKIEIEIGKDGQEFLGRSRCLTEDRFSKKVGVNIALSKVLDSMIPRTSSETDKAILIILKQQAIKQLESELSKGKK